MSGAAREAVAAVVGAAAVFVGYWISCAAFAFITRERFQHGITNALMGAVALIAITLLIAGVVGLVPLIGHALLRIAGWES